VSVESKILHAGLLTALENPHPGIRAAAVILLGNLKAEAHPHLNRLIEATADESPEVRAAAYSALPAVGNSAEIIEALEAGLTESMPSLQGSAVLAMRGIALRPETFEKLLDCVEKHVPLHSDNENAWQWLGVRIATAITKGGLLRNCEEIANAFSDCRYRVRFVLILSITNHLEENQEESLPALPPWLISVIETRLTAETDPALRAMLLGIVWKHCIRLDDNLQKALRKDLRSENSDVAALAARISKAHEWKIPKKRREALRNAERQYVRTHETYEI